jgi:hypothetical protein
MAMEINVVFLVHNACLCPPLFFRLLSLAQMILSHPYLAKGPMPTHKHPPEVEDAIRSATRFYNCPVVSHATVVGIDRVENLSSLSLSLSLSPSLSSLTPLSLPLSPLSLLSLQTRKHTTY